MAIHIWRRTEGIKATSIGTHFDDSAKEWSSLLGRRSSHLEAPLRRGLFWMIGGRSSVRTQSSPTLPVGERGWITLSEARALFSPMDDRYAFGEMDEVGHARHFLAHTEQALFGLCKKRANSESTSMRWQVPVYSRTISQTYNRPRAIPRSKSWQRIRQRAAACGAAPRS